MLEKWITKAWYGGLPWTWVFLPLMFIYGWVVHRKRKAFLKRPSAKLSVPVIVVGNITAGGTGKTPVVQSIVRHLQAEGWSPAIVTRGYGAQLKDFPHIIDSQDSVALVGDEPYMMAQSLGVPVVVDPQRNRAAQLCISSDAIQADVIICDDGLQHYGLNRDIEICVIDGARGLGNGQLIPVGPLREPQSRLGTVNYVLFNGVGEHAKILSNTIMAAHKPKVDCAEFELSPKQWVNVKSGETVPITGLNGAQVGERPLALAGIGNPQRFFNTIARLGIEATTKAFPDHYEYCSEDFSQDSLGRYTSLLMTQKDAVKMSQIATDNMWYLEVSAAIPSGLLQALTEELSELKRIG